MIAGSFTLEDQMIQFSTDQLTSPATATYTVIDTLTGKHHRATVPMKDFLAALSIALHADGDPNATRDYPAAESVQPEDPHLRFIP